MGFLSSLFGSSKSQPQVQTVQQTQKLPPEIAPKVAEITDEAKRLYDERVAEGYVPYEGSTIAPFTQQELDAQAGIEGLVGLSAPLQQEALGISRQQGEKFTADTAQQYMNPYQQAVIDVEKRKAQEDFETRILPQFEKQGVAAGGMSGLGSRAGVQAALLGDAQAQRLGDIQSKGLQSAFTQGRAEFNAQKARESGQAAQLAKAGPAMFASGLAEQGALTGVGEQRRGLAQEALDEAYFRFLEERGEPQAALTEYSGTIYGNPLNTIPSINKQITTPGQEGPSTGSQLLGLGLSAANIYGMGGGSAFGGPGFSAGKLFGYKHGGGLSDLVHRQQGGSMGLGPVSEEDAEKIKNQLDATVAAQEVEQPENTQVKTDDPRYTVDPIVQRLAALGMPTAASLVKFAPTGSRETAADIMKRETTTQERQKEALQADTDSRKELTEGRTASKEKFAREQADKSREALKGYDPAVLSNLAAALLNPDYAEAGFLGAAGTGLAMGIEARQETLKKNKAELRKIDSNLAAALDANEDMLFESAVSGLDKKTAQAMEFIRGDAEALERAIALPDKLRKEYLENLQLGLKIEEAYAKTKAAKKDSKLIASFSDLSTALGDIKATSGLRTTESGDSIIVDKQAYSNMPRFLDDLASSEAEVRKVFEEARVNPEGSKNALSTALKSYNDTIKYMLSPKGQEYYKANP